MTDVVPLVHLDRDAAHDPAELVDVINGLADLVHAVWTYVEMVASNVGMILEVLDLDGTELDEPVHYREIVELPDIATYQEPT